MSTLNASWKSPERLIERRNDDFSRHRAQASEPTAAMVLADKTDRLVITLAVRRETTINFVAYTCTGDDEIAPLA
jgi:hypothetical protein